MSQFRVVLINLNEWQKWIAKLGESRVEEVVSDYMNTACAEMVVKMQDQLGEYQGARGPFGPWEPLKPETIARKKNGDTPLLEEGDIYASIQYFDISPVKKMIGATDTKAAWMEYGVPLRNVPARPFVRPIVWMGVEDMKKGIRKALVRALVEAKYSEGGGPL